MLGRLFGLPTYSIKSSFVVEMMIMKAAREMVVANADVLQRVQDVFITRLYGDIPDEGQNRPLIRLSIVEIEALLSIALEICADHPHDPDAAQRELETRFQRKNSEATIFGLVAGGSHGNPGQRYHHARPEFAHRPRGLFAPCYLNPPRRTRRPAGGRR